MKKKCLIYIRTAVESENNSQQLKLQLYACLELACSLEYTVEAVIKDYGSGIQINKNLADLIENYSGNARTLIALNTERINRNYNTYKSILQQFNNKSINVEFVHKTPFMEELINL